MLKIFTYVSAIAAFSAMASAANAADFYFDVGPVTNQMAAISGGGTGAETADDFKIDQRVRLEGGSFTGLLPLGTLLSDIDEVGIALYRLFPDDSGAGGGKVPTRDNSPADHEFFEASSVMSELTYSANIISSSFTADNSVQAWGINAVPNQTTGGNGPVTGMEVEFAFDLATSVLLDADHYFFVPVVNLANGNGFLWLSGSRPISGSGTPFAPDLQSWIRDANLEPDWLRVGTDIVGPGNAFNGAFSLNGTFAGVPEPGTWAMMILGFGAIGGAMRKRRTAARYAQVAFQPA